MGKTATTKPPKPPKPPKTTKPPKPPKTTKPPKPPKTTKPPKNEDDNKPSRWDNYKAKGSKYYKKAKKMAGRGAGYVKTWTEYIDEDVIDGTLNLLNNVVSVIGLFSRPAPTATDYRSYTTADDDDDDDDDGSNSWWIWIAFFTVVIVFCVCCYCCYCGLCVVAGILYTLFGRQANPLKTQPINKDVEGNGKFGFPISRVESSIRDRHKDQDRGRDRDRDRDRDQDRGRDRDRSRDRDRNRGWGRKHGMAPSYSTSPSRRKNQDNKLSQGLSHNSFPPKIVLSSEHNIFDQTGPKPANRSASKGQKVVQTSTTKSPPRSHSLPRDRRNRTFGRPPQDKGNSPRQSRRRSY